MEGAGTNGAASAAAAAADRFSAVPKPTCQETCQHRNAYCRASDVFLETTMDNAPQTPPCVAARFGDDLHPPTSFEFFAAFEGQRVYPAEAGPESLILDVPLRGHETPAQLHARISSLLQGTVPETSVDVVCTDSAPVDITRAALTDAELAAALLRCPDPYLPHPSPGPEDSPCVLPCHLPLYSDGEVRVMFLAYVIPGVLGSLLCALQLYAQVLEYPY